jgi:plastocyanin
VRCAALPLACLVAFCQAGIAGDIAGQIAITKTLTKRRVTVNAYGFRGTAAVPQKLEARINELTRVAVYLESPSNDAITPIRTTLKQRDQQFYPDILVVPVGSSVDFPNNDPFFHNVFSLSRAHSFDLGYYPQGKSKTIRLDKPGVVQVYCHLHPNMSAAIVVSPTPWYTQPDEAGRYVLEGIPAGTAKLVFWHKSAGFFKRTVEINENGTVTVDLNMPIEDLEQRR